MRRNWNTLLWLSFCAAGLLTTGCGGINASHTVSPASFFLPGLLQNSHKPQESPEPVIVPTPANPVEVSDHATYLAEVQF